MNGGKRMDRNLDLEKRKEGTREKVTPKVVRFELSEIQAHFNDSIDVINEMFPLADELFEQNNVLQAENIWKAQVIFTVSAFDFYMHEITKYGLRKIFVGEWEKTEKYCNISLKLETLNNAIQAGETTEWFLEFINSQFATVTMVSFENIKAQMNMLGLDIRRLADDTFYERGALEKTMDKLKRRLNGLFHKRNVIAHQADRSHANAEVLGISKEDVQVYLREIIDIVNNITVQMEEK